MRHSIDPALIIVVREFNANVMNKRHRMLLLTNIMEIAELCPPFLGPRESKEWILTGFFAPNLDQFKGTAHLIALCESVQETIVIQRQIEACRRILETCVYFHLEAAINLARADSGYAKEFVDYIRVFKPRLSDTLIPSIMTCSENFVAIRDLVCEGSEFLPEALSEFAVELICRGTLEGTNSHSLLLATYGLQDVYARRERERAEMS